MVAHLKRVLYFNGIFPNPAGLATSGQELLHMKIIRVRDAAGQSPYARPQPKGPDKRITGEIFDRYQVIAELAECHSGPGRTNARD